MALLTTTGRFTLLLITVLALSFALLGCGEPNDPNTGVAGAYTILSTYQTIGFANDFDFDGDTLYVAENSLGFGIYTLNDNSSIELNRHIVSPVGTPKKIRIDPLLHSLATYNSSKIVNYLSFTNPLIEPPSDLSDLPIKDLICLVEYGPIMSDHDELEHDSYSTRLVLVDPSGDDGLIIQTVYQDSSDAHDPPDGEIDNYFYNSKDKLKFPFDGNIHLSAVAPVTSSENKYENIDTLVVGLSEAGIAFANISDLYEGADIWMTGFFDTPGEVFGVTYDSGYVYAATGAGGLTVFKVNNFEDAEIVATWNIKGLDHAEIVAVDGNRLALMDGLDGVHLLDITNPASPVYKGMYEVRKPTQIRFRDGNLYVSAEATGITVLRLDF